MKLWNKIISLFSAPKKVAAPTQTQEEISQALQVYRGAFHYEADGFRYPFKNGNEKLEWAAIERITGYKYDLMTTDEICMDIFEGDWKITFSESIPGWPYFLTQLKAAFPALPEDWDGMVMLPPFAINYTVLYEREDRVMPESRNFYAWLRATSSEKIIAVFEQHAWNVRKSGWTEFELFNNWSELNLEPDSQGLLLNGLVAFHPDNVAKLDQLLKSMGVGYQYEFYDNGKQLILDQKYP